MIKEERKYGLQWGLLKDPTWGFFFVQLLSYFFLFVMLGNLKKKKGKKIMVKMYCSSKVKEVNI